jgi:hypothetical protein
MVPVLVSIWYPIYNRPLYLEDDKGREHFAIARKGNGLLFPFEAIACLKSV